MDDAKQRVIDAGRWLATERGKRVYRGKPLSTTVLANLANAYIGAQKLPVKNIHQQEVSNLENATPDKGPAKLPPWWQVLEKFVGDGPLDEFLAEVNTPQEVVVKLRSDRGKTPVTGPDGNVLGYIEWSEGAKKSS